ncbi:MAG TPA: hypothetical protein VHE13_03325 [Opitutus sp.]|nr:hypothetical protein [Opitutus sp.]
MSAPKPEEGERSQVADVDATAGASPFRELTRFNPTGGAGTKPFSQEIAEETEHVSGASAGFCARP